MEFCICCGLEPLGYDDEDGRCWTCFVSGFGDTGACLDCLGGDLRHVDTGLCWQCTKKRELEGTIDDTL